MKSSLPPGPRSPLGVSEVLAFRKAPLAYLQDMSRRYGDIVHFRLGLKHAFLLNHPNLVQEFLVTHAGKHVRGPIMQRGRAVMGDGLLTSEEPLHASQRRLIQPGFHRDRISQHASMMSEYTRRACLRWSEGEIIDLRKEMMELTLAILGKALFDRQLEGDASDIAGAVSELMSLVDLVFVPFSQQLMRLPLPGLNRLKKVRDRLDRLIYALIEERMQQTRDGQQAADLLSMLISHHLKNNDGDVQSVRQIRDECLTILLAGHETIANALTYSLILLAKNLEVAEKVRSEVHQVTGGKESGDTDYDQLALTRRVLAESMRLYPPVWVLGRAITEACRIGEYVAPKNSILFVSQYLIQRDSRFFPEPDRFFPDRFLGEGKAQQFAYFPFGVGPRRCIGEGFAYMEGTIVLANILRQWNIQILPETNLVLDPKITLRPKYPVLVRVKSAGDKSRQATMGSIAS